jgi:outer membrane autotransporter protein
MPQEKRYLKNYAGAAVRAVVLPIALLGVGNEALADCSPDGLITGANGAIVLGSGGCADAPGNTSATVVGSATITSPGTGITSVASPGWAVTNQGTITATGNAVSGDVSFTLTNSGTMTAGLSGAVLGGGSTVVNTVGATITAGFVGLSISANGGSTAGGPSTVDNAGLITSTGGFDTAILLGLGGTVTNRSTGTLRANGAGVAGATNPTTVYNAGQILDASTGIGLSAGGTVTNDVGAVINSQSRGVDIAGGVGTVVNSGSIVANFGRPVELQAGGSVTNTSTGTITSAGGGTRAIFIYGGPSTIVNAGSVNDGLVAAIEVESTQSSITNSGMIRSAFGAGIQLDPTGASNTLTTIVNSAGGTIQGSVNAIVATGNASVDFTNKGTVVGDLVFGSGNASLHFHTGSSLTGNLTAGTGTNTISFNGSGNGTFSNPIANFQTITKQDDGTWTLGGAVSGATAINVTQGTLILTGNNTYTGGTTVSAGILQGNTASLPGSILNNGMVAFDQATTGSYGGVVSGSGSLAMIGPGTLTLAANNTYSGATLVNVGTLQAGIVNAFSATSAVTVAPGATLALNSLNQTIGSLAGAGAVTLGSATLTTGNDGTSTTFAGVLSGSGGLTKVGGGTLSLTGANTYTGETTVNGGTLVVNGSLAGSVIVNSGGTLRGNGTFGSLVANGGILAPGNSIGTFTVNGNFAQNGVVYQVEVNAAGQSDRINASGTATISGGTVQVLAQAGTYARNTTYTILNATGGVSGAYSNVTSNFAFLTPSLSYDANNVYLMLFQSSSAFAAGAQTPNQYAVGTVLDQVNATATGDLSNALNALSVLSNTQGPAALNAISGQQYANFGTMNTNVSAMFMNALGQQMANARGNRGAGQRQALARACEIENCDGVGPWSAWASALGGLGSVLGDGNASTLTFNFGGAAAGIDYRFDPRFLAGVGVGYTHGTQWVNGFLGQGWSDSVSVAAYGSFTQSGFYADALAGYAYFGNQMQRQIAIPGLQPRTASGSTGANQFLGQVESGYKLAVYAPAMASITPFARLQISSVTQNAFSESGAQSLSLDVGQQTTNSLRTTIGADFASAIDLGHDRMLEFTIRLGWQHEFADTGRPITAAFAGAPGNSFTVYGAAPVRDSAVVGFSAMTDIADATQVYLRYDGGVGGGTDNHAVNLGVRFSW